MYDQNDVRWIAKGMTYQSVKQASSSPTAPPPGLNDEIQIPESGDELIMKPGDTGKSIFGMAIDGQLAVFYIRKLWTTIGQSNLLDLRKNVKSLLANIALEFSSKHGMDAAKIESWMKEITDYANTAQSWILELLNQSAAITMSKNYILKTLSQPGCEGIRFYLCMKDRPKETKDKEGIEEKRTKRKQETDLFEQLFDII